jgi:hypothetical protein
VLRVEDGLPSTSLLELGLAAEGKRLQRHARGRQLDAGRAGGHHGGRRHGREVQRRVRRRVAELVQRAVVVVGEVVAGLVVAAVVGLARRPSEDLRLLGRLDPFRAGEQPARRDAPSPDNSRGRVSRRRNASGSKG